MVSTEHGPVRWRAPGRVNLIGEHTDYNAGFVLPFAIERACVASVAPATGRVLAIHSAQRGETVRVDLAELAPGRPDGWAAYAAGVVWALQRHGVVVPALTVALDSTVPYGAGLSSSAALTCSVATALDDLLGLRLSRAELVRISMSAENDFADAPTGGMDQLAALGGEAGHVLFCDMRSLSLTPVPLDLDRAGLALLVVDTKAEHRNAESEYRIRRSGCERAAMLLGVPALRDVEDLDAALAVLPTDELRRYTRHVVSENRRVLATVELLRSGAVGDAGSLLTASHESLRVDFQVSTPELDVAVAALLSAGALGARMTGGGFGGSVIGLLPSAAVDSASAAVTRAFAQRGFNEPVAFTARPSDGARAVGGES